MRCLAAGRKGQESAPFELLIAVIVMIFVMMFGHRAIMELQVMDCKAKINAELGKMKSAIEATTNQSSLQNVYFEVLGCFKGSSAGVKSVKNRTVCSQVCQEGRAECIFLEFRSGAYVKRECVNIPLNTLFGGTSDGGGDGFCPDRTNDTPSYRLTLFNVMDIGVPTGNYVLVNRTPPGHVHPVVCAYRRD